MSLRILSFLQDSAEGGDQRGRRVCRSGFRGYWLRSSGKPEFPDFSGAFCCYLLHACNVEYRHSSQRWLSCPHREYVPWCENLVILLTSTAAVIIPRKSLLSPSRTAAVCGGNVLTSQRIVDVVLKAFHACAASQGCTKLVVPYRIIGVLSYFIAT